MMQQNGKTQILGEPSCFTPQLREQNAQRKKAVKKPMHKAIEIK